MKEGKALLAAKALTQDITDSREGGGATQCHATFACQRREKDSDNLVAIAVRQTRKPAMGWIPLQSHP